MCVCVYLCVCRLWDSRYATPKFKLKNLDFYGQEVCLHLPLRGRWWSPHFTAHFLRSGEGTLPRRHKSTPREIFGQILLSSFSQSITIRSRPPCPIIFYTTFAWNIYGWVKSFRSALPVKAPHKTYKFVEICTVEKEPYVLILFFF